MKKKEKILVKLIFLAFIVCSVAYLIYINKKSSNVVIIEEKSFLSDFEIINNEVHIYCIVSLENKSKNSEEVELIGDFKKEVDWGLVKENSLKAHFMKDDTYTVIVDANSTMEYVEVEFIGEFAGNAKMSSRSLPVIEVSNVTNTK